MPTGIESVGKGAFPDEFDVRDYRARAILGAPVVDWSIPVIFPEPPTNDQNGSSSCVAQAWSYYHWQLRQKDYSRRDIYAQIALPNGGAYIRDGGLRIVNYGQATRDETSDPVPETETAMKDMTGISAVAEASDQELNSFIVANDIDSCAAALDANKGVVFGVTGTNAGWTNYGLPRPPLTGETQWGHALYLFGRHLHDTKKCTIAKSSWAFVNEHHITEDYWNSGYTFNPWTLIPKSQQLMDLTQMQYWLVQNSQGDGAFGLVKNGVLLVASADRLAPLLATFIVLGSKGRHSATLDEWNNAPKQPF